MKHHITAVKSLLCMFLLILVTYAQSDRIVVPEVTYPYLVVTPSNPVASTDDVSLQIMLGEASNSCMAPGFKDISFSIEKGSDAASDTPQYMVYVSFTRQIDSGKACIMVYDPVDYGPRFKLGKLRAGEYRVIDRLSGSQAEKIYGRFSVSEMGVDSYHTVKGIIYDDPSPLDIASRPVKGAMVYLRMLYPGIAGDSSSDRIIAPLTTDSTRSDAEGRFSFSSVKRGTYRISLIHSDYRSITEDLTVNNDRTLRYTMIPVDASASVYGRIYSYSWESAAANPVPGCTVTVSSARSPVVSEGFVAVPRLQAIADENGMYRIENIPVDYNGQLWYVNARNGELQGTRTVPLSNLSDAEVNIGIILPYENFAEKTVNGITYKIMTDRRRYLNRETVKIRYSISNRTKSDVRFGPFDGGCEYDLIIGTFSTDGSIANELYRASDHPICLEVESFVSVPAGETIVHQFPDYVLPDIGTYRAGVPESEIEAGAIVPAGNLVRLKLAARFRGEAYDSSEVAVSIEVEADPPPVSIEQTSEPAGSQQNSVRYIRNGGLLRLQLTEAQKVSVAIHSLTGTRVVKHTPGTYFTAGMHTLSLGNLVKSSGMFILRVRGETFEKNLRAVQLTR